MNGNCFTDDFFDRLERLALNFPTTLTGYFGGKHKINKYGQTIEFADFRQYQPGDDIRRIDWNLYARLGKHFLKLYTDERQMHIRIFIDCSASVGFYADKSEYALALAVAFGYMAVRNNDKVSFHLLKDGKQSDPFGLIVGKNSFFSAVGKMKDISFSGETDFGAISKIADMGSNDGLSVLISDFLTDNSWQKAVEYFLFKKQQVLVCQVLGKEEISPSYSGKFNLVDCEGTGKGDSRNVQLSITRAMTEAYKKELARYRQEIKKFCIAHDTAFLSVGTDVPVDKIIYRELMNLELVK